ncbi:hypothetical protein KSF73_09990 [Burkholderiaceae bacterium DAT-1]|nr:hypothetical protein [Burkholderiaceae bacterium DAT-1]
MNSPESTSSFAEFDQGGFPVSLDLRRAIDRAVHAVVSEVFLIQGFGQCATYAVVGAGVLSKVLNQPYRAVSGGEIIDCGNGNYLSMFPDRKARRDAKKLSDLREYHCWIECGRQVAGVGRRIELVDLTCRHDQLTAEHFGVHFSRRYVNSFTWDWKDQIEASFPAILRDNPLMSGRPKAWYWEDSRCTKLLQQWHQAEPVIERVMIPAALDAFRQIFCNSDLQISGQ